MEGCRTLIVHECLTVATKLCHFHRWQRQVTSENRSKEDWDRKQVIDLKDFRYNYSTALMLLGTSHAATYAHPKLLGL